MNIERLRIVADAIAHAPDELFTMETVGPPACGTAGCIAGWAIKVLANDELSYGLTEVAVLLGMDIFDTEWTNLFIPRGYSVSRREGRDRPLAVAELRRMIDEGTLPDSDWLRRRRAQEITGAP